MIQQFFLNNYYKPHFKINPFKALSFFMILLCILSCENANDNYISSSQEKNPIIDSLKYWISKSNDKQLSLQKRKEYLSKSYERLKLIEVDTFYVRTLSDIAWSNFKLGDTLLFEKRNKKALDLAKSIKDTFAIGDVHWSYATYYKRRFKLDSAYYHFSKANKFFEMGGYIFEAGKTQYGMAHIRGRFSDYSGSEILTFNAIKKFEQINDSRFLFILYNHLALLQNDIQQYNEALKYYEISLSLLKNIDNNDLLYQTTYNNIGVTYSKMNNCIEAVKFFDKALANKQLKIEKPNDYARVIDNKAYCKFKEGDTLDVLKDLKKAFSIRDSLNDKEGILISMLHLSEYHRSFDNEENAFNYANEANQLAKEVNNSSNYLRSLELLSEIEHENGEKYLKRYINFNDSLLIVERKTQNKFTRIDYETDQYIEETERLSQLNIIIFISGFSLLAILSLVYFIKIQKKKTKNLHLEAEQQKANEQVYILTLNQSEKLEKEKARERIRISEELHDGILGKLFGTRLSLSYLDMDLKEEVKSKYDSFLKELQTIEKEIRDVSHRLNKDFDDSKINFIYIIQQLLEQSSNAGSFKSNLKCEENIDLDIIDDPIKVNLYRIIQEAVNNIIKHSSANTVTVEFKSSGNYLVLNILDNGVGYSEKDVSDGIGIKNIKSRVKKMRGKLKVISTKDEGVKMNIEIPIT